MAAPSLRPLPGPDELDRALTRLAPAVLGWCRRLGGAEIDPQEAAQEVLMVVARRAAELHALDGIEPWAFAVTRNVVRSHRRRRWWRRWVGEPSASERSAEPNPEVVLGDRHLARLVDSVLDRLPAEQREVIVLCLGEDRPDSEVARLTGVSIGTVKSRLRLARRRFRTLVRSDDSFAELQGFVQEDTDAE